jgi:hypothetical protein
MFKKRNVVYELKLLIKFSQGSRGMNNFQFSYGRISSTLNPQIIKIGIAKMFKRIFIAAWRGLPRTAAFSVLSPLRIV